MLREQQQGQIELPVGERHGHAVQAGDACVQIEGCIRRNLQRNRAADHVNARAGAARLLCGPAVLVPGAAPDVVGPAGKGVGQKGFAIRAVEEDQRRIESVPASQSAQVARVLRGRRGRLHPPATRQNGSAPSRASWASFIALHRKAFPQEGCM